MRTNMIREGALRFLYKHLRDAKTALGRAENRPNVKQEELDNLQRKIAVMDFIIPLVIQAKRGEWLDDRMDIVCSACGTHFKDSLDYIRGYGELRPNYCPNCGAMMDGKEDGKDENA